MTNQSFASIIRNSFFPLFVTAAILLGGNGLLSPLISVRAQLEGFSNLEIGIMGTLYFFGFYAGCVYGPYMVSQVGHIRSFAVFAALAAVSSLLHVLLVNVFVWYLIRIMAGYCFASLFVVIESWLNEMSPSDKRGKIFANYRMLDLFAVIVGQFFLALGDPKMFHLFVIIGLLCAMSMVPIAASTQPSPSIPPKVKVSLVRTFRFSPLAFIAVLNVGLTGATFRTLGPVFGQEVNMSLSELALFLNIMILGGASCQYLISRYLGHHSRRLLLMACSVGTMVGVLIMLLSYISILFAFIGVFIFGAFSLSIYGLAIAHANDFAKQEDFVNLSAGLLLVYSVGAIFGPLAASIVSLYFGIYGIFYFVLSVQAVFIVYAQYRYIINRSKPAGRSTTFVPMPRTISPVIFRMLAKKTRAKNSSTPKKTD